MPEQNQQPNDDSILKKPMTRRDVLRLAGTGGLGLLLGGGAIGTLLTTETKSKTEAAKSVSAEGDRIPFYGTHQAGIITPAQNFICFAAFDVTASGAQSLKKLFQAWTAAAAAMAEGMPVGEESGNYNLPPTDTGESAGLSPSRLTITFGAGPSLFDERFGLASKKPPTFKELPAFNGDQLEPEWCGGDIGVQVCADDMQVAFHAVRNLARIARGKAVLRWVQEGFQRTNQADPTGNTPRNLLGFKDGTANPQVTNDKEMNRIVWAQNGDGAPWMAGGSYMAVRRIRMRIEVWDRSSLKDQEDTFGRYRASGAPLGAKNEFDPVDLNAKDERGNAYIPRDSHVALARGDGSVQILRRSYSYSGGMDMKTGQLDAGLLFISYQRDLFKQFVALQQKLAKSDRLNEYILHVGSAAFACFPGAAKGGYIGDTLF
ncbi:MULTISPECIES: iron uptake transporter deferrochelatase/peroxidase subunit [Paenibacillus]|uniref:Deferrochelatase n=1 Tax=Paenibacillus albilobatus TaxID=2716884 RepID=A0A920CEH2_9BACL|nr:MULTISPECIES: iron uptake transporter deferrochelatase/peroxidase subunit [Paenibacillus]GIO33762.1 putative deferrochelatase/peroxidase EfeN [Paenibacillus albilobatus]